LTSIRSVVPSPSGLVIWSVPPSASCSGPDAEGAVGQPFAAPPRRAAGTQRDGLHHLGQQLELEADRNPRAQRAVGPLHGDDRFELSVLVGRMIDTRDECRLGADERAQLVRDRREDLRRSRAAGYQRGHASQRRLLIHELTQPCPFGRVMARGGVGGTLRVSAFHDDSAGPARNRGSNRIRQEIAR